jgi:phage gpG-like protein
MEVRYTELKFAEIKNKMSGSEYGRFKADLATIMMGQRLDTFRSQSSPDGPWAATKSVDQKLMDSRADYHREMKEIKAGKRKALSKKAKLMRDKNLILIDKGVLRASFSGRNTGIQIYEDEVMIFTNVEYAPHVNFGTKFMPARRFDLFTEEQIEELREYIESYLNE